MDPFSFGSTTALIAEEADRFDVEASLKEATLWQVLMVCKENIVTCKCVSVGAVCAGKVTRKCTLNGKKVKKIHGFVALLRPWERTGENARKKRLVFLRLKTKGFFAFLLRT